MRYTKRRGYSEWRWWHWRFAMLPTWFGEDTRLWLEFYQCRMDGLCGERRDRSGKTVEFCYYP